MIKVIKQENSMIRMGQNNSGYNENLTWKVMVREKINKCLGILTWEGIVWQQHLTFIVREILATVYLQLSF